MLSPTAECSVAAQLSAGETRGLASAALLTASTLTRPGAVGLSGTMEEREPAATLSPWNLFKEALRHQPGGRYKP